MLEGLQEADAARTRADCEKEMADCQRTGWFVLMAMPMLNVLVMVIAVFLVELRYDVGDFIDLVALLLGIAAAGVDLAWMFWAASRARWYKTLTGIHETVDPGFIADLKNRELGTMMRFPAALTLNFLVAILLSCSWIVVIISIAIQY